MSHTAASCIWPFNFILDKQITVTPIWHPCVALSVLYICIIGADSGEGGGLGWSNICEDNQQSMNQQSQYNPALYCFILLFKERTFRPHTDAAHGHVAVCSPPFSIHIYIHTRFVPVWLVFSPGSVAQMPTINILKITSSLKISMDHMLSNPYICWFVFFCFSLMPL